MLIAGNSLAHHNGKQFTTKDVDNDEHTPRDYNCAQKYGGGWWYYYCCTSSLNSKYYHRYESSGDRCGLRWDSPHGGYNTLKATEMKLISVA